MPAFDNASHEDPEDLRVLREALGPARREPIHADAMRAALRAIKARRLALETARRRIAVARRVARERVFASGG